MNSAIIVFVGVVLVCTINCSDPQGLLEPPPSLTFGESFNANFNGEIGWEFVLNGTGMFSKSKADVDIICTANYPIQLNVQGHIMPPEFVKVQPFERTMVNETYSIYKIKMIIFFNPIDKCFSSSVVTCQKISNPVVNSSIQVFVPDDTPLIKNPLGSELVIRDDTFVPCPTTNPNLPVSIFKRLDDGTEVLIKDAVYNPVEGFQLQEPINGELICSSGEDKILIQSVVSQMKTEGFDYFPKTKTVKAFTSESIIINCSSSNESLNLVSHIHVEYLVKNKHNMVIEIKSQSPQTGHVRCNRENGQSIYSWAIEFIQPPELYLDNFESEFDCLSNNEDKSVSAVRCRNPSDCSFMKHCFINATLCNYKRQKQFYSELKGVRCWIQERKSGAACASLPYYSLNGLVQCNVAGVRKHWEFFTALDFKKYSNWEAVSKNDLIRMDPVDNILYTGKKVKFFCEAVAFLFADSLKFAIIFENGTEQFFKESEYSKVGIENPRKMDEFNILSQLELELPVDAVAIKCHAPWWNSTEFLSTEQRFVVKESIPPSALSQDSEVSFKVGETNRHLKCLGATPGYRWIKDGKELQESKDTELSAGSKGNGILTFPFVTKTTAGTYICEMNNLQENFNVTFMVHVKDSDTATACNCDSKDSANVL